MPEGNIDVEDKDMPIDIEELQTELSKFYHQDKHLKAIKLIHHFDELLGKEDLVTNSEGDILASDSDEIIKFKNSDLYKIVNKNEGLR